MVKYVMIGAVVGFFASGLQAKGVLDLPVASVTNRAYLTDMADRPWWNSAWKRRAAVLVSNRAYVRETHAMIDFVLDVGEQVDPNSIRVTTPWGAEVPCVCEKAETSAVRLLFETSLRERENKPFLVYWGNPSAAPAPVRPQVTVTADDQEICMNNGAVEVVFDNLRRTPGLMKTLRVVSSQSPSELLWRTSGFAWHGFECHVGGTDQWSKGRVTSSNAYRATVAFTNAHAELEFSLFAGQPRVDYAYRLKPGVTGVKVDVSWACGGGCANDDFIYEGAAGRKLSFSAALDHVSDCLTSPEYYNFKWLGKGWYAIRDRKSRHLVGHVFDRKSLSSMNYLGLGQSSGENVPLWFSHRVPKGECASGSGAVVATIGDVEAIEHVHNLLAQPPAVFVMKPQDCRDIPVRVPQLDRDFCVNCNVGGWRSSTPLEGGEWMTNILDHIQALGANTLLLGQLTDYNWRELPLSKDLFDRIADFAARIRPGWRKPEWKDGMCTGDNLKRICAAAHADGMAVCTWHNVFEGLFHAGPTDESVALCGEFQALYPQCGTDSTFNPHGGGEAVLMPGDLEKKYGRQFWNWPDPQPFFDQRKRVGAAMKAFYDYSHKVNPNTKVMVFNSDNGELGREMCMSYYPGTMDTLFCEFVAGSDVPKIKHVAKRLRGFFDNVPAKTIHAHYYIYHPKAEERVYQLEVPFICGINGFSQESMTYENFDREYFEVMGDFNRLALYTKLGEKAAKMAPVKNLAVFRDMNCFEEDYRRHRTRKGGWGYDMSLHDKRVYSFAEIRSYNYDVVVNPHFKADSLKRYKAVYIPEDEVLSEDLAKELLLFVRNGGGAVIEGATAGSCKLMKRLSLEDGQAKVLGKGKIVWTKDVLTDSLMKRDAKAIARVKELVSSVGGETPFEIESKSLDGILQASKEGLFLGVYNRGDDFDSGRVEIRGLGRRSRSTKEGDVFVLDVKRGVRFAYTNGFEIAVGPQQCGFYLIGDDRFTAVPEVREARWTGATAAAANPSGFAVPQNPDPDFRPRSCVEFVGVGGRPGAVGEPGSFTRSKEAMLVRKRFCPSEDVLCGRFKVDDLADWRTKHPDVRPFEPRGFAAALKTASYVHFRAAAEDCDMAFETCAEPLKDLLKRGGGILFDRNGTGPKARAFLKEVGVFDPYESAKRGVGDGAVVWDETFPTNHPLVTANKTVPGWQNGSDYTQLLMQDGGEYGLAFTKWDVSKQRAPFRAARDTTAASLVIQEQVLGAGKVVFNENRRSFNDWYETKTYGNSILSWLIGMSVKEHAEKTRFFVGGVGEVLGQ